MKKIVLLLLLACFVVVAVVGCGGPEMTGGGAGAPPETDDVDAADDLYDAEDEIDWGSDETFDDVVITLPGEGDDVDVDTSMPEYLSVTGEITLINVDGSETSLTIETPEGGTAVLTLCTEVVFPFSEEFDVGDTVTGWYLSAGPMMLMYPPHYNITVLAVDMPEGTNIKVDRFDPWEDHDGDYLISQDGMFAFTADENTEVVLADGQDFTFAESFGRRIVVIYGMSTRSIPEMATANRLIVLFESITAFG